MNSLFASVFLILLAAARPHYGGVLRLNFFESVESYEPQLASSLPEKMVSRAVYEPLVRLDDRGNPMPGLAASWHSEQGGKRWTFQLRGAVRFQNGTALNAGAVRASFERAVAASQSPGAAVLRVSQFLCSAPAPDWLACDLSDPHTDLPLLLADPTLAIADADGAGTGPFKVAAWTKGVRLRLEAYDFYSRGRPFLDAVEFEFGKDARRQRVDFELKQADVLVTAPTETRLPGELHVSPATNLLLLGFAATGPQRDTRCTIAAHLDREAMAGLLPPGRAEAARALLPGWVSGYDFLFGLPSTQGRAPAPSRAPLRLLYDASDPVSRLMSSRLLLDLRPAGVELRPDGQPRPMYIKARESGQYDLYLESVRLHLDDPAGPLGALLQRFSPGDIASEYHLEQTQVQECRMIPLLHWSDIYVLRPGFDQVRFDSQGVIDLPNSWLR